MNASRIAALFCLFLCCLSPFARAGDDAQWPGIEYSTVRAYLYRGDPSSSLEIVEDGKLTTSVDQVARLPQDAGKKIAAALRKKPDVVNATSCFKPHHAFVYFDRAGTPVAWLEVCFSCENNDYNPPIPEEKMWDQAALKKLLRKHGIPVPGDATYAAFEKAYEKAVLERYRLTLELGNSNHDSKTGVPPPSLAWPWRPFAKAKLYAFNENGKSDSIVELGKVNPSVTKEIELTAAQVTEVWTAFRRSDPEMLNAEEEIFQVGLRGRYFVHNKTRETRELWVPGPRKVRHGLVCFDEKGAPVAWMQLSFSDFTYFASPADDLLSITDIRWSPRELAKIFPKLGIPIDSPKEKAANPGAR